jgi:tripartite ATP-independent transporter DctM subunit
VSGPALAGVAFAAMIVLLMLRMPIGLAMFVCGSGGYILLAGLPPFLNYIKSTPYYLFSNYTLSVIPLFILMGCLAEQSGLSRSLFRAAHALVGHRRGGIAMASIAGCAAFGAVCGSSVATTAAMGRAALPELRRYRYADALATGTLAVGGTLGILIPPSIILVVYAISTEQNIAKLFMAALIPGLMATVFYMLAIAWTVRRNESVGPAGQRLAAAERRQALLGAWPGLLIAVVVVGGIYGGIFTPTEGAGVGVIGTLVLGLASRTLGWTQFVTALLQAAQISAMIFLILLGAEIFNAFLGLSQLTLRLSEMIGALGLPAFGVLGAMLVVYILLGGVMDELAMILLTLPVFFPIVIGLDFGLPAEETAIWFGVLVLIICGIGLTAPPIGLNVFVINGIARNVPITVIYRGVLPLLATDFLRLGLVLLFPGLALAVVRLLT